MDRVPLSPTLSNLDAGALRADRARLMALVFAIEEGLADGTAPAAWRELRKAAHWMRSRDLANAIEQELLRD